MASINVFSGKSFKLFPGLKLYFLNQKKCPVVLRNFFENPQAEVWLYFVHCLAATFHQVVVKLGGEYVTAVEVTGEIMSLSENLKKREDNKFLPLMVKGMVRKLENDGLIKLSDVQDTATEFYKTCYEYLDLWSGHFEELKYMQWALLKKVPQWPDVEKTFEFVITKQLLDIACHSELFDNFACASN